MNYNRPCKHFLQGRCYFGSRCRNVHPEPSSTHYPPSAMMTRQEPEETGELYNLLEHCWDQLMWKGSPLWKKDSTEPFFYGLNLCIDELRWEFYSRPSNNWLLYQQNLDNYLQHARRICLRQRYNKNYVAHENFKVPVSKVFQSQPFYLDGHKSSHATTASFKSYTNILDKDTSIPSSQPQYHKEAMAICQDFIFQSPSQTLQPHVLPTHPPPAFSNLSFPFNVSLSHEENSSQITTYSTHPTSSENLSSPSKDLQAYSPEEIQAYLAPHFLPYKIPVNPPPMKFR